MNATKLEALIKDLKNHNLFIFYRDESTHYVQKDSHALFCGLMTEAGLLTPSFSKTRFLFLLF